MMTLLKEMNDEGHHDNVSNETQDDGNDDVPSIFISSLPSVMESMKSQLHMNAVYGLCDNSRPDWWLPAEQPWLQFRVRGAAEWIIDHDTPDWYYLENLQLLIICEESLFVHSSDRKTQANRFWGWRLNHVGYVFIPPYELSCKQMNEIRKQ